MTEKTIRKPVIIQDVGLTFEANIIRDHHLIKNKCLYFLNGKLYEVRYTWLDKLLMRKPRLINIELIK